MIRTIAGGGGPRYVVVCTGGAPGGTPRDFTAAPLSFDPGPRIIGKHVDVYADPQNSERYYVRLEPLFESEK